MINISLIRKAGNTLWQDKLVCGMQGDPPVAAYYNHFYYTFSTENDIPQSDYWVNVTASNYTFWGRNTTTGASTTRINVKLQYETEPPRWWNNWSTSPPIYNATNSSNFSVRWTDNVAISTALIEISNSTNVHNYTMTRYSGDSADGYYSYTAPIQAGNNYWRSFAMDTSGNWNVTDTWYFTINKADNPARLYLRNSTGEYADQNMAVTYGTQTNATATALVGATLFQNNTSVSSATQIKQWGGGVYEYRANATGNTNYSANFSGRTFYLTVNPSSALSSYLHVTINGSESDQTLQYENATIVSGYASSTIQNQASMQFNLYLNNVSNMGTSSTYPYTVSSSQQLGVAAYTYIYNTSGNANYTSGSATRVLTITKRTPGLTLGTGGTITYGTAAGVSGSSTAFPQSDFTINLYRNNTGPRSTDSAYAYAVSDSGVYSGGYHLFVLNTSGGTNYSSATTSTGLTINTAAITITLFLNSTNGNVRYMNNSVANLSIATTPSGLHVNLSTNYSDTVNKLWAGGTTPFYNNTLLTITTSTAKVYNFTAVFNGTENYTANTATHYATVGLNSTLVRLYINGSQSNKGYETGLYVNLSASVNVTGKTVYLTVNGTNWSVRSGTTRVENTSQFSTDGVYNVTAWFPGDASYDSDSQTYYLTMSTTPPAAAPTGGGGGGGGAAAAPPSASYDVTNYKEFYSAGDTMGFYYTATNPNSADANVVTVTTITKDGKPYKPNIPQTDSPRPISANGNLSWSRNFGAANCSDAQGVYQVLVEWLIDGESQAAKNITFAMRQCKAAKITIVPDKAMYIPYYDTAHITVTTENVGNADIRNGLMNETLNGPMIYETLRGGMNLPIGGTNVSVTDIKLDAFPGGLYSYDANLTEYNVRVGSGSAAVVILDVSMLLLLLPLALLLLILLALWKARGPLVLKKRRMLLAASTAVRFKLTNRTKHAFKNAIITDRIPAEVGTKGISPEPSIRRKQPNGSVYIEWHVAKIKAKEVKQFHYDLNKRKRFLPHAKLTKYERDRAEEERAARAAFLAAGRKLTGKAKEKHAEAYAKMRSAKKMPVKLGKQNKVVKKPAIRQNMAVKSAKKTSKPQAKPSKTAAKAKKK